MKKFLIAAALVLTGAVAYAQENTAAADSTDTIVKEQPQEVVITQPMYRGGFEEMYKFIMTNFDYPEDARKRSISGTVEVEFTVEKSGDITFVGILKGIDPDIDEELIRVLKEMPLWIPATRNGVPTRYKVSMPITLKLSRSRNGTKSTLGI